MPPENSYILIQWRYFPTLICDQKQVQNCFAWKMLLFVFKSGDVLVTMPEDAFLVTYFPRLICDQKQVQNCFACLLKKCYYLSLKVVMSWWLCLKMHSWWLSLPQQNLVLQKRKSHAEMNHIHYTSMTSLQLSTLHNQPLWKFGQLHVTMPQNEYTNLSFLATLWLWMKVQVTKTGLTLYSLAVSIIIPSLKETDSSS